LCYQCHTDVKPAFSQPFHHRVEEGLISCSDCHDPHGTFNRKNLRATADQNAICTKCHSETAGPFAYEHPVVKAEGCLSCHSPHGSPNARLLNVSNVNMLCLQCHSATNAAAFPHAVSPTGPVHNQAAQYVSCTTCHTQVHGSHASNIFFK
jgi:DmsE family decaheme c-type cytochrome